MRRSLLERLINKWIIHTRFLKTNSFLIRSDSKEKIIHKSDGTKTKINICTELQTGFMNRFNQFTENIWLKKNGTYL